MSVVFMPQTGARSEKDTYFDVAITFEDRVPHFHFKHKRHSLFTYYGQYKPQGYRLPENETNAEITLYKPHSHEREEFVRDLALRPPSAVVGDFEITIIPE